MHGSANAARLDTTRKNPAYPPAHIDPDETLPMNDSSLPPVRSDQSAHSGRPMSDAETSTHADTAASASTPAADAGLKPRRRLWPLALGGLAAALLIVGIVPRLHASAALTRQTAAQSVVDVAVVTPRASARRRSCTLVT